MVATLGRKRGRGAERPDSEGLVAVADIIDADTVSQMLGKGLSWTWTLARYGQIPVLKNLGTDARPRYLFDRRAIEQYIREKHAVTAGGRK